MSYRYHFQHMQQLMAPVVCNAPMYNTMSFLSPFYPIQNVQPKSFINNETILIESDSDEDDVDERTLFCANLDERVMEELLYEVFLQAGPIQKVYIPKDNNTGKRRSYGFVTYKHRCTPPYAIRLYQGLVLFGKRLDIKLQGKYNFNRYNIR